MARRGQYIASLQDIGHVCCVGVRVCTSSLVQAMMVRFPRMNIVRWGEVPEHLVDTRPSFWFER